MKGPIEVSLYESGVRAVLTDEMTSLDFELAGTSRTNVQSIRRIGLIAEDAARILAVPARFTNAAGKDYLAKVREEWKKQGGALAAAFSL